MTLFPYPPADLSRHGEGASYHGTKEGLWPNLGYQLSVPECPRSNYIQETDDMYSAMLNPRREVQLSREDALQQITGENKIVKWLSRAHLAARQTRLDQLRRN